MENVLINTILKGVGIYIIALLITRSICTKLISQMNFFDFIMGVSMGSIVASTIIDKEFASLSGIVTLILFTILTIVNGYLNIKSVKMRKIVNSEPVTLVQNGTILDGNMKKIKLTIKADYIRCI